MFERCKSTFLFGLLYFCKTKCQKVKAELRRSQANADYQWVKYTQVSRPSILKDLSHGRCYYNRLLLIIVRVQRT